MHISNISVSRDGVYKECHQKYKYKYHLKLVSEEPEPIFFSYGKLVHKIAEEFVNLKGKALISEVATDVLKGKIEIEPGVVAKPLTAEYKRKLPDHLRALKKLTDRIGYEGTTEYKFSYDLDPPKGLILLGFIDRLIEKNGKYWIIDYKTTKKGPWRKTSRQLVTDLQLRCYARVVQKEFNVDASDIKAALYYLDGAELCGAKFSNESLENVEKYMKESYLKIQSHNPEKVMGTVGDHCRRCDYRKICPFYHD